ncbi:hypothetical protein [Deinococcus koreensis]|uniref:Uncharacterized protein n=1 Tax=Deinococcus koreensis TaxID=2054903 RepID=A0A2K3UZH8_9DEIO|nr:hypothetical protein [Deinococcus koreensis]PNY81930.1 hypothetical protein CVO96_11625 [Deinococcus koreensis]
MNRDPLDVLKTGDGGGEVWAAIERRIAEPTLPPLPLASRVCVALGLDGTPVEAALRAPPAAALLGLGAALTVLAGGLIGGPASQPLLLLGPLLAGLAGGVAVYSSLDPAYELTRASGNASLLVLARQLLLWLLLGGPLLLALPWLPPGFLAAWLLPCLLTHSLALAVGLPFGAYAGLGAAALTWVWLLLDFAYQHGERATPPPPFPDSAAQALLILLCLLATLVLAGRHARRPA